MAETNLIEQMFGAEGLMLEGAPWPAAIRVEHGPLTRLPALFQQPLLQDLEQFADRYRGPLSFGRGLRSPQTFDSHANPASLLQLGLTVFLQDVAGSVPGAAGFLRQLERELGVAEGSARLSAFASPGDDGVSCHYDAEEVISIQLLGSKTFHVAPMTDVALPYGAQFGPDMVAVDNLYEQARDGFPDPAHVIFETHDMRPGSVLFLPRGTWHKTAAAAPSLSLSIVIRPPVLADALLGWLKPWLLGDPRWRLPVYGNVGTSGLHSMLEELAQRLNEDAATPVLAWSSKPSADSSDLLRVPGSHLICTESPDSAHPSPRLRLQVTALDQDWRQRITLDSEVPAVLQPAIVWLQQRQTAFNLNGLGQALPQIGVGDLRQLLDLLIKAHALWPLVPR